LIADALFGGGCGIAGHIKPGNRISPLMDYPAACVRHLNDTVERVRRAMRIFELKSDVCDNSLDARCNRPGVRDAFAQIKREEALQRASASR